MKCTRPDGPSRKIWCRRNQWEDARIAGCTHDDSNASPLKRLAELGEVTWSSCNIFSTQDMPLPQFAARGIPFMPGRAQTRKRIRLVHRANHSFLKQRLLA
ncbi:MAG: adenosylhomocysteinase [Pirellulaceae bacterium]